MLGLPAQKTAPVAREAHHVRSSHQPIAHRMDRRGRKPPLIAPAAAQTPPLTRDVISPPAPATRVPLPLSPGVRVGDVIYVSGQVELDVPDITGQATSVLKKVQAVVEAAGTTMAKVDKCTVFLTRQSDFAPMNEVWRTFFPKDPPARTTVIVAALARAEFLIEIECIAHR
jgi:2-iminobutanoate/2-iminopropanoate deaminase